MSGVGVEITDLRAGYGKIEILHGISLTVDPGSVFALLGPNGAGKTTLLQTVAGRVRASSGSIAFGGVPLGRRSVERLARDGICSIPEGRGVFPNLSVRENLRIWTYATKHSLAEVEAKAYETFPRLGMRRGQPAGSMSGGEQQMLAISRALVTDPKVLLLDELSMGLAPIIVGELYELVGQIAAGGVTVLLAEQFVTTAIAVATRAAIVTHGRISHVGEPGEMAEVATSAYLAS